MTMQSVTQNSRRFRFLFLPYLFHERVGWLSRVLFSRGRVGKGLVVEFGEIEEDVQTSKTNI